MMAVTILSPQEGCTSTGYRVQGQCLVREKEGSEEPDCTWYRSPSGVVPQWLGTWKAWLFLPAVLVGTGLALRHVNPGG